MATRFTAPMRATFAVKVGLKNDFSKQPATLASDCRGATGLARLPDYLPALFISSSRTLSRRGGNLTQLVNKV